MRQRLWLVFYASTLLLSAFAAAPSLAEVPQSAKQQLQEILLHDEFQPRTEKLNVLEQLWRKIQPTVRRYLGELWDKITNGLGDAPDSVPSWLFNFSNDATALLSLVATLFLLFGIGLVIFRIAVPTLKKLSRRESRQLPTRRSQLSLLKQLMQQGEYRQVLQELRKEMRLTLSRTYPVSDASTDREICAHLPAEAEREKLFQELAQEFECVAYAQQATEPARMEKLYQRFSDSTAENK